MVNEPEHECYFCVRPGVYSVKGATDAVKRDVIFMCASCGHAFSFGYGLCVKPVVDIRTLETSDG